MNIKMYRREKMRTTYKKIAFLILTATLVSNNAFAKDNATYLSSLPTTEGNAKNLIIEKETPPDIFAPVKAIEEYRFNKYDMLSINVLGFKETDLGLNDIVIGPDGYVSLPYAGIVKLSGLTVSEGTQLIKSRLERYVKIPQMTVMVKQYGPRKIYVMGEVEKPGVYSLELDYMNVFAALSSAGGIKTKGRPKHVYIVRVVGGKVYKTESNIEEFIKKQDMSQNIQLYDGDMIYVPKSGKITLNDDIAPLLGPIGLLVSLTD